MRTTTMGCTTWAGGVTPGMRRPVRTMTEPPMPSRKMRFGLPTSPVISGVTVAAFRPRPVSRMAAAASADDARSPWRGGSPARGRSAPARDRTRARRAPGPAAPRSRSSWPVSSPSHTTSCCPVDTRPGSHETAVAATAGVVTATPAVRPAPVGWTRIHRAKRGTEESDGGTRMSDGTAAEPPRERPAGVRWERWRALSAAPVSGTAWSRRGQDEQDDPARLAMRSASGRLHPRPPASHRLGPSIHPWAGPPGPHGTGPRTDPAATARALARVSVAVVAVTGRRRGHRAGRVGGQAAGRRSLRPRRHADAAAHAGTRRRAPSGGAPPATPGHSGASRPIEHVDDRPGAAGRPRWAAGDLFDHTRRAAAGQGIQVAGIELPQLERPDRGDLQRSGGADQLSGRRTRARSPCRR